MKVFPYEYQRALKQQTKQIQPISNGSSQTLNVQVKDIEDAIANIDMAQHKLDKIRC